MMKKFRNFRFRNAVCGESTRLHYRRYCFLLMVPTLAAYYFTVDFVIIKKLLLLKSLFAKAAHMRIKKMNESE